MSSLPSGTVTFLFTDIEGSTQLIRTLGDRYGEALSGQRRLLREAAGAAGGREIDTQGDAFFFSFPRARDAVSGAVAAQRALAAHEWPDGADVRVRMGLHTGEPAVGEEGYHGLDVVRAARICSAAHGGQILLSETTRALLGNDLPDGVAIRDLGRQELKDVQDERIFQLTLDRQRDEFPPLRTPRRQGHAGADVLGDDFEQRIDRFVQSKIRQKLDLKGLEAGTDTTDRLAALPSQLTGLTLLGLAIVAMLVVGIVVVILVVRFAFF